MQLPVHDHLIDAFKHFERIPVVVFFFDDIPVEAASVARVARRPHLADLRQDRVAVAVDRQ